jgi:hypothetical protein
MNIESDYNLLSSSSIICGTDFSEYMFSNNEGTSYDVTILPILSLCIALLCSQNPNLIFLSQTVGPGFELGWTAMEGCVEA